MKNKIIDFIKLRPKTVLTTIILIAIIIFGVIRSANAEEYIPFSVPEGNTYFKAYEDYKCITDKDSDNYKFLSTWCWVDFDGFVRADGESDLGIKDNYYCVAMGSFYGTKIGTKYKVTTDTGRTIYCVLCDQKADCDTHDYHRVGNDSNDVLEFIVNTYQPNKPWHLRLNNDRCIIPWYVSLYGSTNTYMPLNGQIVSIEKICFGVV